MVALPDGKNFEDMYNCLDSIPACDRRTDRRTDILPWHSLRYAYASRGKNGKLIWNPYMGLEPHQKLISSSDWRAQS